MTMAGPDDMDRIRKQLDRGERPPLDDVWTLFKGEAVDVLERIDSEVGKKPSPLSAATIGAGEVLAFLAAYRLSQYQKRIEQEDRIAALEIAVKPRHRVKAPTRPAP